jgi:hypothetical protein
MLRVGALVSIGAVTVTAAVFDRHPRHPRTMSHCLAACAPSRPVWAYPSPYDAEGAAPGRFADTSSLTSAKHVWDLPKLVDIWRNTKEEAWPWVWCDRNPVGPHHVFINVSEQTLALVAAISLADVRNNVTVVVSCEADLASAGITEQQLNAHRSAVIFVPLEQLDADNKILMLADERIIVYDFAYLA